MIRESVIREMVRRVLQEGEALGSTDQVIVKFEKQMEKVLKLKDDKQKKIGVAGLAKAYQHLKSCHVSPGSNYYTSYQHLCKIYQELSKKYDINLIDYKEQLEKDVKKLASDFKVAAKEEGLRTSDDEWEDLLKEMYQEQILEKYYDIWVKLKKSCRDENYENELNNDFISRYEMLLKAFRSDESEYGLFQAMKELITGKQLWYNKK